MTKPSWEEIGQMNETIQEAVKLLQRWNKYTLQGTDAKILAGQTTAFLARSSGSTTPQSSSAVLSTPE